MNDDIRKPDPSSQAPKQPNTEPAAENNAVKVPVKLENEPSDQAEGAPSQQITTEAVTDKQEEQVVKAEPPITETNVVDENQPEAAGPAKVKKKSKLTSLPVVASVLITILLVGLGYAAFMAVKNERNADTNESAAGGNEQTAAEPATGQDVEEIDAELDRVEQDLNEIENQLDSDDLSDESLGI